MEGVLFSSLAIITRSRNLCLCLSTPEPFTKVISALIWGAWYHGSFWSLGMLSIFECFYQSCKDLNEFVISGVTDNNSILNCSFSVYDKLILDITYVLPMTSSEANCLIEIAWNSTDPTSIMIKMLRHSFVFFRYLKEIFGGDSFNHFFCLIVIILIYNLSLYQKDHHYFGW